MLKKFLVAVVPAVAYGLFYAASAGVFSATVVQAADTERMVLVYRSLRGVAGSYGRHAEEVAAWLKSRGMEIETGIGVYLDGPEADPGQRSCIGCVLPAAFLGRLEEIRGRFTVAILPPLETLAVELPTRNPLEFAVSWGRALRAFDRYRQEHPGVCPVRIERYLTVRKRTAYHLLPGGMAGLPPDLFEAGLR